MKDTASKTGCGVGKSEVRTGARAQAGAELSTGGLIMVSALNAVVGTWAVACIVGGLVAAGGPLAFVKSWFTAVSGM